MAEKPILFSTAMVRAILDDDKTMTRRILKPQPNFPDFFGICIGSVDNRDIGKAGFGDEEHLRVGALVRLPYGTELEINGQGGYIAEDTGGAIKGNRIDIYMLEREAALYWGRQPVEVRIIE